jgi:pimeloyl-ACP methyl ester carboxylesterase
MARAYGRGSRTFADERAVVFVHGWLAGGAVFDPMRASVEAALGIPTVDFTYAPWGTFEQVASQLERFIAENLREVRRISLVGHSLGGLIVRSIVQSSSVSAKVDVLVTLATPHGGVGRARFGPTALVRALDPAGDVVRGLGRTLGAVPTRHVVIVAEDDRTVSPSASAAAVDGAQVVRIGSVGHNGSLFDTRVHGAVVEALRDRTSAPIR